MWQGNQTLWGKFNESYTNKDNPISCDLRYQGQIHDHETGLYYNRHRYYDSDSCQYLSSDPIGLAGGIRPQSYVADPVNWVDPLGFTGCPTDCNAEKNNKSKIKATEHSELRSTQGRSTAQVHSDLQNARSSDIFVQNDGRFIVRGPKAREHIIDGEGNFITTVNGRSNKAHLSKIGRDRFRATEEEVKKVKSFLGGD